MSPIQNVNHTQFLLTVYQMSTALPPRFAVQASIIEQSLASSATRYVFTQDFILRENITSPELESIAAFRYQLYDRTSHHVYTCDAQLTRYEISGFASIPDGHWTGAGTVKGEANTSRITYRGREGLLLRQSQATPTPLGMSGSINCVTLTALPELEEFRLDPHEKKFLPFHRAEYAPFEFEVLHYLVHDNAVCSIISSTIVRKEMTDIGIIERILNLAQGVQ